MRSQFKRVITPGKKERLASPDPAKPASKPALWPDPSAADVEDWLWMTGLPGRARTQALLRGGQS